MTLPRIAVLFTGGTISMLPDPATGAARPVLDGAAILARTPGAAAIADLVPVDWGLVPASHLSFPQILDLGARIRALQADPAIDGIVVVQGTDVIEETAFAWDLLAIDGPPVIVTGAMRTAAVPGWDGPENLRAAIRAAATPALRDSGVLVLLDGLLLPADDATKTHTDAIDTFQARNSGPLGTVRADRVRIVARRGPRRRLVTPPAAAAEPVALVTVTVATDGAPVRWARDGGARGIVVAATGSGNTDPDVLAAAEEAIAAGIPVVLASRAAAGRVAPAYGFPGGGARWIAAGALPAGSLTGPKARVALALGIGAGLDTAALRALLAGPA